LKKEELIRYYREIWRVLKLLFIINTYLLIKKIGKGIPKPAKYDEIQIKYLELKEDP
jgi:hypothetical protein